MVERFVSKVNYFDVKVGMTVHSLEFVQAEKGSCSYYKCVIPGSKKQHYLFTHEVEQA